MPFSWCVVAMTLPIKCRFGQHPVSKLHTYTFVVSRAFMAGVASHAGDTDSSRAPGLTSGLQGSLNVHSGALCWCHSDSASVLLCFTLKIIPKGCTP